MPRTRKPPTKKAKKVKKVKVPKKSFFGRIFTAIGNFIKRLLRPFRFVLKPFKTKPLRFIGRWLAKLLLINYFISSWKELKQVSWPNRKQTTQLTFAVFIFSIVFGIMIAIVDYGLDKLFKQVLLK